MLVELLPNYEITSDAAKHGMEPWEHEVVFNQKHVNIFFSTKVIEL